jgi:hypothetical protein
MGVLHPLAAAAFLSLALPADAQTLGELARHNEETRKTAPRATKTYTSQQLYSATGEIAHYELTWQRWQRFRVADMEILKALEKDPQLFLRLEALRATKVGELEQFMLNEPSFVAALRNVDMTVREYAYTHTALATAEILSRQPDDPALLAGYTATTRANIQFVRQHFNELFEMHMQAGEVRARIKDKLK